MLEETFVSIGQKCGFVSIADEDRAIEQELRKEIAEKDQAIAEKDQTIADKDREIMDQAHRIAELEAKLASMG